MNLKNLSVLGHALMVIGIVPLVWWKALFTLNPLALIVQLVGVSTMIWARITFGSRSFHASANPTDGQLITRGALSMYPASDLFFYPTHRMGGNRRTCIVVELYFWINHYTRSMGKNIL